MERKSLNRHQTQPYKNMNILLYANDVTLVGVSENKWQKSIFVLNDVENNSIRKFHWIEGRKRHLIFIDVSSLTYASFATWEESAEEEKMLFVTHIYGHLAT